MASRRAYTPSLAVLRALSHPTQHPQCPLVRLLPLESRRGAKKSSKKGSRKDGGKDSGEDSNKDSEYSYDPSGRIPLVAPKELRALARANGHKIPKTVNLFSDEPFGYENYELDLDNPAAPMRLITSYRTPEQAALAAKKMKLAWEFENNPKYDNEATRQSAIDEMLRDPDYADLRDDLEAMKLSHSDEDLETMEEDMLTDSIKHLDSQMKKLWDSEEVMNLHEWSQKALENPDYAPARNDILEFQSKLPQWAMEPSGLQDAMAKLDEVHKKCPGVHQEIAKNPKDAEEDEEFDKLIDDFIEMVEEEEEEGDLVLRREMEKHAAALTNDGLDALLIQIRDLMKALGGNKELEEEIQTILEDDPRKPADEEEDDGKLVEIFDANEVKKNVKMLQEIPAWDDNVDEKARAVVDQIIGDPHLLRKLTTLKRQIRKAQREPPKKTPTPPKPKTPTPPQPKRLSAHSLTTPSAPDPMTLDGSRLVTYKDRLAVAENDPEHLAALRRLQIRLLPPFNVSPALRSLNEALKLAYLGASDDVRRVVWRSYMKARTVPTLLQNIPDDAWDMLWYSQAVTWRANENRESHMKILLRDLNSVGREGPPTHPDTLREEQ